MKRLIILALVASLVGLGIPALAAYHQVYTPDGNGTSNGNGNSGWRIAGHTECEMFSEDSDGDVYQWQSAEGAEVGSGSYMEPTVHGPIQFDIINHAHVFPWIDADITETHLTWDIFLPGDYMAKTFIIQLRANCPVQIHLGGGTWLIPAEFVGGKKDGHIELGEFTEKAEGDEFFIGDKIREYSLLRKDDISGTPPDEIEVRYYWYTAYGEKPATGTISDEEFAGMPPKEDWPLGRDLNCESITILDTEQLHEEGQTHIVFFEDLDVEACDSEGKYVDLFAITITPDP